MSSFYTQDIVETIKDTMQDTMQDIMQDTMQDTIDTIIHDSLALLNIDTEDEAEKKSILPVETIKIHPFINVFPFLIKIDPNSLLLPQFYINEKLLWNYFIVLCQKLTYKKRFSGYFHKTMNTYFLFKNRSLSNPEKMDYYRRCIFLSHIQYIILLHNRTEFFQNSYLIKMTPSKKNKKTFCIIDDSTITNKDYILSRETDGSIENPHRGYKLFFSLSFQKKNEVIDEFYQGFIALTHIFFIIQEKKYIPFDPIQIIQDIVTYAIELNSRSFIYILSNEIYDLSHTLPYEQQIQLLRNTTQLYTLWNQDFIRPHQGKFRIFVLCLYFITYIKKK